ncbi:MAG TPA: hypothetical protein ACFYEF_10855 [Candidatus Wunengus sp. YC63]|uniref:hypothetical protein n=1 Tax=Candidatus Wunengus sp. YC63 TaxID=3367699 RepID=UPI004029E058
MREKGKMKTWLEFEQRFRQIAAPLQEFRINFHWSTAGEHWRLCGMPSNSISKQFEALAELAGKALQECSIKYPELLSRISKEKEPKHVWYRALKELSKEFKTNLLASQQDEQGNFAGHIFGSIMNIGEASANLCLLLEAQYPLPVKESVSMNGINISNSNIGILNTGEIEDIQSISVNITSLSESGAHEVAEAIKQITEAVSKSSDLVATNKSMVLEQLEELSEQALLPAENRSKPGILKAIISTLATTLAAAGGLAEVWSTWGPAIQKFFGL